MLLWAKNVKDKIRKLENSPSTIWKKEIENTVLFSATDVFQRKNTLKTWKKAVETKHETSGQGKFYQYSMNTDKMLNWCIKANICSLGKSS